MIKIKYATGLKWYTIVYKYLWFPPIISYTFTIKSDTKNLITWDLKWFWEFPIFFIGEGDQGEPTSQRWTIFQHMDYL
jgi:hypothetical protein